MPKKSESARLTDAGKLLHDEIGPLLSAAGLKLQLVAMDFPGAAPVVRDVTAILDQAIDCVRALSRELHPPAAAKKPVRKSR
jgi:signal transduction histidine kinase